MRLAYRYESMEHPQKNSDQTQFEFFYRFHPVVFFYLPGNAGQLYAVPQIQFL
jgi:hypothetical protein